MVDVAKYRGIIESGSLVNILQLLSALTDCQGSLRVRGLYQDGIIQVSDGVITLASYGVFCNERAVQEMLTLSAGDFAFYEGEVADTSTYTKSIDSILLDGL